MANLLDKAVERIVIETAWLPPIEVARPFATGAPASAASRFLQPRVSVYTPMGGDPIVIEPYGVPPNNWPYVKLLAVLGVGLVVAFHLRRRRRGAKALAGLGWTDAQHEAERKRTVASARRYYEAANKAMDEGDCKRALIEFNTGSGLHMQAHAHEEAIEPYAPWDERIKRKPKATQTMRDLVDIRGDTASRVGQLCHREKADPRGWNREDPVERIQKLQQELKKITDGDQKPRGHLRLVRNDE